MKSKLYIPLFAVLLISLQSKAQLFIDNATFTIQTGATVTVQGDVTSNVDILGPGKLLLKGSANQNVNMNGFTIPNLEMDNAAGATLTGNARIGTNLNFLNGKIQAANFNLRLMSAATATGAAAGRFVETAGTGQLQKDVTADITGFVFPVGSGTDYMPLSVTNTGSTYSSAVIGVQNKGVADPNKHPRSETFLTTYWPITKAGITGGTTSATGTYVDPTRVTGTEADLRGIYWNGTSWSLAGGGQDAALNTATAGVSTNSGEVYAMNRFVLSKIKVMLQGAFNGTTMNDGLRTPSNLIPLTDPYRSAPYSPSFTHVNNATPETAAASVFNNAAIVGDNIVDWIYVELRDNSGVNPGAAVIQTRAALVQRDGDVVDVDGVSPLYFKNINPAANYTIAIRHRNHLGLATDPVANLQTLSEATPATTTDFTTMTDAQLFGTAAAYTISGGVNLLWGGNANFNTNSRFNGIANDKDYLLITALGNNPAGVISNTYHQADMNMNRTVRFNGIANDKDFLLITVLGNGPATVRTQALPL